MGGGADYQRASFRYLQVNRVDHLILQGGSNFKTHVGLERNHLLVRSAQVCCGFYQHRLNRPPPAPHLSLVTSQHKGHFFLKVKRFLSLWQSSKFLSVGVYSASGQMFSVGGLASVGRFALLAKSSSACFSALHNGSRYLWHRIGTFVILTCHYWITSQINSMHACKNMSTLLS